MGVVDGAVAAGDLWWVLVAWAGVIGASAWVVCRIFPVGRRPPRRGRPRSPRTGHPGSHNRAADPEPHQGES